MASASVPYPQLDVIAVGAHPDDVEIACGGTLAKLVKQGYRVGIIDLTDGEPTPESPGPEVRLAEAQQAALALGVTTRVTLDLPNRRLFDTFEARVLTPRDSNGLRGYDFWPQERSGTAGYIRGRLCGPPCRDRRFITLDPDFLDPRAALEAGCSSIKIMRPTEFTAELRAPTGQHSAG